MSNIVFIFGAGTSRECGGPLMNDFLDKALDLYKLGMPSNIKKHFENVLPWDVQK